MKDLPLMKDKERSRWAYHSLESAAALKAMTLLYAASPLFNGNPAYSGFVNSKDEKLFSQQKDPEKGDMQRRLSIRPYLFVTGEENI